MKKMIVCLLIAISAAQVSEAQFTRHIIRFKDKAANPFTLSNPSAYLSARAIQRRTTYSLPVDSTDLPVSPRYIDSIAASGSVIILNVSKWLNAVTIQTTDDAALAKINSFPFVKAAAPLAAKLNKPAKKFAQPEVEPAASARIKGIEADFFNYGSAYSQIHIHNGEFLHNIGLRGQNMVIGVLDAGFKNYLSVKAFDSARANGQILGTWDFVGLEASVDEDNSHGMECLSTIAANIPGQFVGTAPKASFYLFRSEDIASEYPIEGFNWVCAAERVDSVGGDMISSSLGYNTFDNAAFDHPYFTLDGNTTMAAIGADLAAKKGILVVNSAGNEGNNSWGKIVTPADGDSVLAVGAVNAGGVPAGFSSRGPSGDGQVKPDLASVGVSTVIQLANNSISFSNGTSYAASSLAGLAACLWQGFREYNNIRILNVLRQSGNRFLNPDNVVGFGIPDVKKAVLMLLDDYATSSVSYANCKATISWSSKDVSTMRYEIERMIPGQPTFIKVGERMGTGATFNTQSYQFEDGLIDAPSGNIIYRIRQVIDTAAAGFAAGYIDTVSFNMSTPACISGNTSVVISPNPASSQVMIRVTTPAAVPALVFKIFNTKGQLVAAVKRSKAEGTAYFEIPVAFLASGLYYVSVYNGDTLIVTEELIRL